MKSDAPLHRARARLLVVVHLIVACWVLWLVVPRATVPPPKYYPADAGLLDFAREYQVRCDGSDETQKIVAGVQNANANAPSGRKIGILPPGDCAVSSPIQWKQADGRWMQHFVLAGAGKGQTRLHLVSGAPAFQFAADPKAVLYTASQYTCGAACAEKPEWEATGSGNKAFANGIQDLSIVIEPGNPGAACVDFLANNMGFIRDVDCIDVARTAYGGILLSRYGPGPSIIADVEISGFQQAIRANAVDYAVTIDRMKIHDPGVVGIWDSMLPMAIRQLQMTGTQPLLLADHPNGHVALIDSSAVGGSSVAALGGAAKLFVRGLHVKNYARAIENVAGRDIAEYVSDGPYSAFPDDPRKSLSIPVPGTPRPFWSNRPEDWVNVSGFPVGPDGDFSDAFRAAFATGKPMVYATSTSSLRFKPTGGILVPATVKTIVLFMSDVYPVSGAFQDPGDAPDIFVVQQNSSVPLTIMSMFSHQLSRATMIHQKSQRKILVQDAIVGGIVADSNTGAVFLEDVLLPHLVVRKGAQVYASSLNIEQNVHPENILVDGGTAVVLGYKTELPATLGRAVGGGRLEILGGMIAGIRSTGTATAFVVDNACGSFSYAEGAYFDDRSFKTHLAETRDGIARSISNEMLPNRVNTFARTLTLASARAPRYCPP